MLLEGLVAASSDIGATRSRKAKTQRLADVLVLLDPGEIEPAVGFLVGAARQGRIGVGWAAVRDVRVAPAGQPSLSIGELDDTLTTLAAISGEGSQQRRHDLLADLLGRATRDEADFIRRLLIGELRQGSLAGLMNEGVAKAAGVPAAAVRRAAMLTGDLGHVAEMALTKGRDALDAVALEVMRPVQPMLASTAADVASAVDGLGECSVEWKLDGIRIQVHRSDDDVVIVTRNLNDVTGRLSAVADLVRTFPADSFVLDGEVIGVAHDETGEFDGEADAGTEVAAFQDTASQFSRESNDGSGLVVRFFDLLYRDGRSLIDEPLLERRAELAAVVGEHLIPGELTDSASRAAAILEDALRAGHEGVMIKAAASTYAAGRRGKEWRKVKPVHTFDLAVLAAEWGHGRRQGWLSNLHLGARGDDGTLLMVGKTFKGLTDALLKWQTEQLLELTDDASNHVVQVRPELVVEIAIDGVQRSTRYPGGLALRFARVRHYRSDKSVADVDSISALEALLQRGSSSPQE